MTSTSTSTFLTSTSTFLDDVKEWSGPFFDAQQLGVRLNFDVDVKSAIQTHEVEVDVTQCENPTILRGVLCRGKPLHTVSPGLFHTGCTLCPSKLSTRPAFRGKNAELGWVRRVWRAGKRAGWGWDTIVMVSVCGA